VGLGLAADRAAPPRVPAVTMSLADVPEPLLCTLEYETSPRVGPAITSVQVTPPAPRGDLSLLAAGAPLRDLTLLLDDPEGPVKVTVGREQREVSVQVEVPTGLLVAVREAQAPIRTALGQQGLELGRYEVLADAPGQGGDRAPAEDQGSTQERENRAGRRGVRAGRNSGSPCAPAGGRRRLLDVRARRRPWRSTTWGLGR
jgi:hypothetical protein